MKTPSFSEFFLKFILKWEGGYCNDPGDPGGATKYGVTHEVWDYARARGWVTGPEDVKDITLLHAEQVCRIKYFEKMHCSKLPGWHGFLCLDFAYNAGFNGIRCYQRVLSRLSGIPLAIDGIIGAKTVEAASKVTDPIVLIEAYHAERERYYRSLKKLKKFLRGWLNRNNDLRKYFLAWYEKSKEE